MILELIVAIGIFCFLLIILAKSVDNPKQHGLFKVLVFFFIVACFILLAKASLDSGETCVSVLNYTNVSEHNITSYYKYGDNYTGYHWDYSTPSPSVSDVNLFHSYEVYNGVNTDYVYGVHCYSTTNNTTHEIFYKLVLGFVGVFFVYVLIFYSWVIFKWFGEVIKAKRR